MMLIWGKSEGQYFYKRGQKNETPRMDGRQEKRDLALEVG